MKEPSQPLKWLLYEHKISDPESWDGEDVAIAIEEALSGLSDAQRREKLDALWNDLRSDRTTWAGGLIPMADGKMLASWLRKLRQAARRAAPKVPASPRGTDAPLRVKDDTARAYRDAIVKVMLEPSDSVPPSRWKAKPEWQRETVVNRVFEAIEDYLELEPGQPGNTARNQLDKLIRAGSLPVKEFPKGGGSKAVKIWIEAAREVAGEDKVCDSL